MPVAEEKISEARRAARAVLLACALACPAAHAQSADTVLVHGRIHTLDSKSTVAEALAIRGERIVARACAVASSYRDGFHAR